MREMKTIFTYFKGSFVGELVLSYDVKLQRRELHPVGKFSGEGGVDLIL